MVVDEGLLAPIVGEAGLSHIHSVQMPMRFWLWRLVGRQRATCSFVDDVLFVRPLDSPQRWTDGGM